MHSSQLLSLAVTAVAAPQFLGGVELCEAEWKHLGRRRVEVLSPIPPACLQEAEALVVSLVECPARGTGH